MAVPEAAVARLQQQSSEITVSVVPEITVMRFLGPAARPARPVV
jgi:hypothetical protein